MATQTDRRKRIASLRVSDSEGALYEAAKAVTGMAFLSDWMRETLNSEAARVLGQHVAQAVNRGGGS